MVECMKINDGYKDIHIETIVTNREMVVYHLV